MRALCVADPAARTRCVRFASVLLQVRDEQQMIVATELGFMYAVRRALLASSLPHFQPLVSLQG